MPIITFDELAAVLFATGFLGRAGQDAWAAARRRVANRHRRDRRLQGEYRTDSANN